MAMSMGGSGASAPQMNVTPLIDVLLVLIIIFMVIVAQSKEKGFKTEIPQPPANPDSAPPPARTVVIQLGDAKGAAVPLLKINQQDVSWHELKAQLSATSSKPGQRRLRSCKATMRWTSSMWPMSSTRPGTREWSGWGYCRRRWRQRIEMYDKQTGNLRLWPPAQ